MLLSFVFIIRPSVLSAEEGTPFLNKLITNLQIIITPPGSKKPMKVDRKLRSQIDYLLGIKIAEKFNQEKLDKGIDRLKLLDIFSSIHVEKKIKLHGVHIKVTIEKQPVIKQITISGNYPLFKNEVRRVISARIGEPLNLEIVQQNADDIKRLYMVEGYYQVQVLIRTEKLKKGQDVSVTFRIEKGLRTRIQKVEFEEDGKPVEDNLAFQRILKMYPKNNTAIKKIFNLSGIFKGPSSPSDNSFTG